MSSTINAVVGMVPPRRASASGVIAHPATVAASLPSSRMGTRDRAQSWRGKYLRALNICPDDSKTRVRAMSFHRSDYPETPCALSRSFSSSTEKEDEERKSLEKSSHLHAPVHFAPPQHHIRAVPLRAPSTHPRPVGSSAIPMAPSAANPYGFATRPAMARGRRCHTDPFEFQERVSAPIQIPSASGGNNQLDGNDKYTSGGLRRRTSPQTSQGEKDNLPTGNHTPNVRLLSWEEPVAMLAAADAVSKGWRLPPASAMSSMELGVRRERRDESDATVFDHMDEDEDDHDAHGGDIFTMDDSEDDASDNQCTSMTHPPMPLSSHAKSRRRYRTESMNIVSSGREKRTHHEDGDDHEDMDHFHHHVVSQSFVPPHQMVDRTNCFSIGLRDELKKRRPANPI